MAIGNPNRFLTRQEQLEYRTITTLLELTNVLRVLVQLAGPNENHRKLIQPPIRGFETRGRAPDLKLYELLSHFTNLTIRNREVVALVPEDKDAGRVSLVKGPEVHNEQNAESEQTPDLVSEYIDPRAVRLTRNPTKYTLL